MDWSSIASKVADAAPILGTLLAGPQGALVGSWIAKKFGTEGADPSVVLDTLNKDAEWSFKLKQLEADHETEILTLQNNLALADLQAEVDTLKAVNGTMQVEAASEKWWVSGWRPFWGFTSGFTFLVVSVFFCYLMYMGILGKQPEALQAIPNLVTSFTMLFGIPGAILGIASYGRNKLKIEQLKK